MKKSLTAQSTITTKYQTVIPVAIRQKIQLGTAKKLVWHVVRGGKNPLVVVSPKPKNWAKHVAGLGKRVWKDVDTDVYLRNLRREWQR